MKRVQALDVLRDMTMAFMVLVYLTALPLYRQKIFIKL